MFKFSSSDTPTSLTTILCLPLPTLLCSLSHNSTTTTTTTSVPMSPPTRPLPIPDPRCPYHLRASRPLPLIFSTLKPTSSRRPGPSEQRPFSSGPRRQSQPSSSRTSVWKMVKFCLRVSLSFQVRLSLPKRQPKCKSKSSTLRPSPTPEKPKPRPMRPPTPAPPPPPAPTPIRRIRPPTPPPAYHRSQNSLIHRSGGALPSSTVPCAPTTFPAYRHHSNETQAPHGPTVKTKR